MNRADQHYIITKDILLGKKLIRPEFKPFIDWFEKTYNVEIANTIFELATFPNHRIKTPIPSLFIAFKYKKGFSKFHNDYLLESNVDLKKNIAEQFKQILTEQGLQQADVLIKSDQTTENNLHIENLASVHFHSFEDIESSFVKRNIPETKVQALKDKINNKDIHTITNNYSGVTIILYTEKQVQKYRDTEEFEKWKDLFFELIQECNQLVFYNRECLFISLNSKERIDKASLSDLSNYR